MGGGGVPSVPESESGNEMSEYPLSVVVLSLHFVGVEESSNAHLSENVTLLSDCVIVWAGDIHEELFIGGGELAEKARNVRFPLHHTPHIGPVGVN